MTYQPDIILLVIGTNDVGQDLHWARLPRVLVASSTRSSTRPPRRQ